MRRPPRRGRRIRIIDFWGGFSASALIYDTGSVLDEGIRTLRDDVRAHPLAWANGQAEVWRRTGLASVVEEPIVISFDYVSFDDYWTSFSTGPTSIAQRLTARPSCAPR